MYNIRDSELVQENAFFRFRVKSSVWAFWLGHFDGCTYFYLVPAAGPKVNLMVVLVVTPFRSEENVGLIPAKCI